MNSSLCTIVVIPRDRFSLAEASYASLSAHNPSKFPVIYVDSCHPQPWAGRLDALADEGKLTLIRTGCHLSQHEAYNLAIPHVRTPYVIFVDNDIFYTPDWAEALVTCAEETGAAAVTGYIHEKEIDTDWRIHMCGGDCGVVEKDGQLWFEEFHAEQAAPLRDDFVRCRTGMLEYHAFLVRYETLQKIGPFDEAIWLAMGNIDGSLMIRASGGDIWFEPTSVVKFPLPPPLACQDVGFFINRWSSSKIASSTKYFSQKWGVHISPGTAPWYHRFRRRIFFPFSHALDQLFQNKIPGKIARGLFRMAEPALSWSVETWTHDPHRHQKYEARKPWRVPGLDRAQIEAFSEAHFRQPRPMSRELASLDESATVSIA